MRAVLFGQLHGGGAERAGATVDQHAHAAFDFGGLDQGGPRGLARHGRVVRSKSRTPNLRSMAATRRDSVAPGTPRFALARLKLPVRATSTNKVMSRSAERSSIG